MNAYKVTLNKESAIRQWQNVLAFGTAPLETTLDAVQKNHIQQKQSKVTFEVLP